MAGGFANQELTRDQVDAAKGFCLLQFGIDTCGHCQAAKSAVETALTKHPDIAHIKVEDGRGRPLGRSFAVKLWPTLILLKDGKEVGRIVRPTTVGEVDGLLGQIQ